MCHDLEGHLNGIIPAPPTTLLQKTTCEDGQIAESKIRNPDFVLQKKQNQTLVAYITATLSKEALHTIFENLCAKDLWNVFAINYSYISEARIMQFKHKLYNLNMGSKKIVDYLAEIKDVIHSQLWALIFLKGSKFNIYWMVFDRSITCFVLYSQ